jgi:hypothetical protein
MFNLDRKVFETAILEGFVAVPATKQGAARRFGFWDTVNVGIFADLLQQGLYRRHAASIAGHFDLSLLEGREDDGRDLWLLAEARESRGPIGRDGNHPGFRVNSAWVKRSAAVACLPMVEPQEEGESKAARRSYFQRRLTAVCVSALAQHVARHGADGDLRWRLTSNPGEDQLGSKEDDHG